mmetsp:Transcript_23829/g.57456  ORF Transcript_23829/g.57456 Transcript_23829/m.57456 type:complete len:554 (-) Transcript_23829:529-2190(-)|eukprot:CAMPEP_0181119876 /NCGR_PEP_ID=MMETSP1071-20121207/23833_1 /TAXON_ID=35127 /ORGANISM="Thalassiosira sp., Strain NH16" /LENGTH=553 /DNA_ID=CAMNT_0023204447 /DNA_START=1 /DNA_END=1662 /DNA_ORIENTATION=-
MSSSAENDGEEGVGGSGNIEYSLRDGLLCNASLVSNFGGFGKFWEGGNGDGDSAGVGVEIDDMLERISLPDEDEEEKGDATIEGDEASEDPGEIGKDPWCVRSLYGGASSTAVNERDVLDLIGPNEDGGLVWTAKLVEEGTVIKPRRGMPSPVSTEDFLSSVVRVGVPDVESQAQAGYDDLWERDSRQHPVGVAEEGADRGRSEARWIFRGVMNGWPGLTLMEVRNVRVEKRRLFAGVGPYSGKAKKIWDTHGDGNERGVELSDAILEHKKRGKNSDVVLVELRAPSWTSQGWSAYSPGFVFWVEGASTENKASSQPPISLRYGTDIKTSTYDGDPTCTMVHMINHRYSSPKKSESAKDKLTYHSFILLEWDHRKYCSVVEIGYLNGLGGYKGKSNWFEDKDAKPRSRLYEAFPPELVLPYRSTMSEIRVTDVPYKNKDDFVSNFMKRYEGHSEGGRFVDINCSFSNEVRLTYNSRSNVATYLLNYIRRNRTYSEMRRNCQTFAADLCGFLAGKGSVSPYHPVNQIQYYNTTHYFLYESSKYSKEKKSTSSNK